MAQTYKGKPVYTHAPYSWDEYDRVSEETVPEKAEVVAWEECDGGNGRCKCPSRCMWAIINK